MGSYCSVMNDTSGTMYCKYGPNLGAAQIILGIISFLSLGTGLGPEIMVVAAVGELVITIIGATTPQLKERTKDKIEQWFSDQSYSARGPGSEYVSDKLSLSLVVSAHCATLTDVGGGKLELRIGSMTTWTGPTANSTNRYNVSECEWSRVEHPMNSRDSLPSNWDEVMRSIVPNIAPNPQLPIRMFGTESMGISSFASSGYGAAATMAVSSQEATDGQEVSGGNLAEDKELLAKIQELLSSTEKGEVIAATAGVAPVAPLAA